MFCEEGGWIRWWVREGFSSFFDESVMVELGEVYRLRHIYVCAFWREGEQTCQVILQLYFSPKNA